MKLRAFSDRRKNDESPIEVFDQLMGPPPEDSCVVAIKFVMVQESGQVPVTYLFGKDTEHAAAVRTIIEQDRQNYDALLSFAGAGVVIRDPDHQGMVRIGWGSTSCMQAFGEEAMTNVTVANERLAQLHDALRTQILDLHLPLHVSVHWQPASDGTPIGAPIVHPDGFYSTSPAFPSCA